MASERILEDISFSDFGGYFRDKNVLVSGHTGFKGSWLSLWLTLLGARVSGIALDPPTKPNNYDVSRLGELLSSDLRIDIRDRSEIAHAVANLQPDVIFHLAAQPIVAFGIENPYETFEINVMGTASVLEAVRLLHRPCVVVVVTSDKCYENAESPVGYKESDRLGGSEPYGASKAAAEIVVNAYRNTYFSHRANDFPVVSLASARAGNVIGGGDWSAHRILPDIVESLANGEPISLRSPDSVRPWQHVLVPLSGYLMLAAKMLAGKSVSNLTAGWNFGPTPEGEITVSMVAEKAIQLWNSGSWVRVDNAFAYHEKTLLSLNIDKAIKQLGWYPRWNFDRSMERTIAWYKTYQSKGADANMQGECIEDIKAFCGS